MERGSAPSGGEFGCHCGRGALPVLPGSGAGGADGAGGTNCTGGLAWAGRAGRAGGGRRGAGVGAGGGLGRAAPLFGAPVGSGVMMLTGGIEDADGRLEARRQPGSRRRAVLGPTRPADGAASIGGAAAGAAAPPEMRVA